MSSYRTCPETGFKIDLDAEKLIKWNAVTAVVFLLVGGFFGLLVGLTRWPSVHLLPADLFYLALTAHGVDILLIWVIFFEMALLYFCSSVLLQCRVATPKLGWLAYWLMLIGAAIGNVAVLMGESSVMFTSYVPLKADPMFYLALILFAVGALIVCFIFFGTLVVAKKEKTYEGSLPLVTFGAMVAAIIAVYTIASGAVILIPTLLWSLGFIPYIDSLLYKVIWWGMGHSSQQINVSAQVACWYAGAAVLFGARPISEKVCRTAFLMYILFLQLASAHHLLVEPGLGAEYKIFNTSYAFYLAVFGSMIHGLTVPGAIELAQRRKGYTKGLFEWLRKCPWGHPAFSATFLSIVIFGFLGGISGVVMGTEQLNLIMHNTIYVPGHFHATVAGGTTLAFMGIAYWLVPTLWQRELWAPGLAKIQPYLFGIGISGIALFQMGAGTLGVSRRHWDMTFSEATLTYDYPAAAHLLMALNGISAIIASVAGAIFCLQMVFTIIGKKKAAPAELPASPQAEAIQGHGHGGGLAVPGTFVLALVFLTCFVLYFFVNWKYLSEIWILS